MKGDIATMLEKIRAELTGSGSPSGLESARRFFKPDERVEGYGVASPKQRQIAGEVYRLTKSWPTGDQELLGEHLWRSGMSEEGAIVCYVWQRSNRHFGEPQFRLFTRWLDRYVHNWAHCDALSLWLLGACVSNQPALARELVAWTASPNRWRRRAAAVSLVPSARAGLLTAAILRVAAPLLPDADLMVQKGVGWLLKETYPRHAANVMRFLIPRRSQTTRLVLRYAAEKMTPADRARLLVKEPGV